MNWQHWLRGHIRTRLFFCMLLILLSLIGCVEHIFIASGGKKRKAAEQKGNNNAPLIALGYVRQSYSRDEDDTISIDRQMDNIKRAAAERGYILELYADIGGHKSGRDLKNRPQMVECLNRLGQPGVRALIVEDLARLFRKGWRVGELLDLLQLNNMILILSGEGRQIDLETLEGKLIAHFMGMVDQFYAEDIALRIKNSQIAKQRDGKTVALPPYGSFRRDGFLQPSPFGIWLLHDGRVVPGIEHEPPENNAIWRGYYDCAEFILRRYCRNDIGTGSLTRLLRDNGWFFRTQQGHPRPFRRDDVRRVIAAWPQYAGLVVIGASKDRRKGDVPLDWKDTGRNIFDLPLLRLVAQIEDSRRLQRAIGSKEIAYPYMVRGILKCALCGCSINGTNQAGRPRYRHAQYTECISPIKSVTVERLDTAAAELLARLRFSQNSAWKLNKIGQSLTAFQDDLMQKAEVRRRVSLAQLRRKLARIQIDAEDGRFTMDQYRDVRTKIESRMVDLSIPTPPMDMTLDFDRYVRLTSLPYSLLEIASPEERQTIFNLICNYSGYPNFS